MVCRENVASILPEQLRRQPFLFEYDEPAQMSDAILSALDGDIADPEWDAVASEFSVEASTRRLEAALQQLAARRGEKISPQPIHALGFDIRLGRHHSIGGGTNQVDQPLGKFCQLLRGMSDAEIANIAIGRDPELQLAGLSRGEESRVEPVAATSRPAARQSGFRVGLPRFLSRRV
jgi:hypothetical protein